MEKISVDFRSFAQVTKEFIKALGQKRTYSLFENAYCIFGILWGIPVPIVTIGIHLYSARLLLNLPNIMRIMLHEPFYFFFLLHPVFFGIVFGAMGTVRYNKQQKIEELDKQKSNFLSMVSHELRTPLTTVAGYVSFLLTEKPGVLNQTQKESLKIAAETADLLNHLIEELLDLSKIERGEFRVNLAHVDMAKVVHKAVTALRLYADSHEIGLECDLPHDLPLVWADKERILQVMTNLLENAVKFSRIGGKITIAASVDRQNSKVVFCVSDTGIGIPPDKRDRIFDKFYQADSSENRKYGGCGLGLAISKSIIELHRGKIWIESEEGIGSKFFFELLHATVHL